MSYGTPASASSTLSWPGIRPATGWIPNLWRQKKNLRPQYKAYLQHLEHGTKTGSRTGWVGWRKSHKDGDYGNMEQGDVSGFWSGYTHFPLHSSSVYHLLSVWACVSLGVHSSQTQLAMSYNQGRKLTAATEVWRLPLRRAVERHPKIYFLFVGRVYVDPESRLLSVLGSISGTGCWLKKSVSALHVILYSPLALADKCAS